MFGSRSMLRSDGGFMEVIASCVLRCPQERLLSTRTDRCKYSETRLTISIKTRFQFSTDGARQLVQQVEICLSTYDVSKRVTRK